MFERFTDRARRVVVLAQEEARLLNHSWIGTEHLLLGLIHEGDGVAAKALEQLGISLEAVRTKVQGIIGAGGEPPSGHIPFTPRAKKVLELSLREALQLGHNYIGTEHILLGLIREGEGVAAQVLVNLGADLSAVRQAVIQQLSGYKGGGPAHFGQPGPRQTPAVTAATAEARRLAGGKPIGSDHWLRALVADANSMAGRVLAAMGVTPQRVDEELAGVDPAGTSDETPEEAGARRIRMRVEGKLLTFEIDDAELAEALEKAMQGRTARIITGSDPEAAGFPNLWSAVSRTVDDLTRRLSRVTPRMGGRAAAIDPTGIAPGWDPAALAAGYVLASTKDGPVGHFELGSGIDRAEARAWLRSWLEQNRSQLAGPAMEDPDLVSAMWVLVSRSGQPFGLQRVGFEAEGGGAPVPVDTLIGWALDDLAA
jgi:hypothetical protein